MIRANTIRPDVGGGFYTAAEAARLLGMHSTQRILRWLSPTSSGEPAVITRTYAKLGREHELSFFDLLEVRFVEHFRSRHISLQSLRLAAKNARRELGVTHPFATSSVKFQSDRKQIFLETAEEAEDRVFLNLMTNQLAIYEFIEDSLARDLEFDVSGFAKAWKPAPGRAPDVIVSPVYAFGQPTVSARHLPTVTLFSSWEAEGGDYAAVANWHSVTTDDVRQAVEFELRPLH